MDELVVLMAIDCRVAAVTDSVKAFEVTPFCAAVMLEDPTASPLAKPLALIAAAVVLEDSQVVDAVRFCVVPSLNVPIAVN
jgi:hypothetical protein